MVKWTLRVFPSEIHQKFALSLNLSLCLCGLMSLRKRPGCLWRSKSPRMRATSPLKASTTTETHRSTKLPMMKTTRWTTCSCQTCSSVIYHKFLQFVYFPKCLKFETSSYIKLEINKPLFVSSGWVLIIAAVNIYEAQTQERKPIQRQRYRVISTHYLYSVTQRGQRGWLLFSEMTEEEMMDLALRLSEQEASDRALRLRQEEEAVMKAIQESVSEPAGWEPPAVNTHINVK